MLMSLAGCATSGGDTRVPLAAVPDDIRACLAQVSDRPAGDGSMTTKQIVALIARLRASELRLSGCGKRLLALYDAQASAMAGEGK